VRGPTAQLLPAPLDGVQPRAVTGQPLEFQVRVVPQGRVDRLAAMPRGVVDHQDDAGVALAWIHPPHVAQVGREGLLHPAGLALAGSLLGVLGTFQGIGMQGRTDQVDEERKSRKGSIVMRRVSAGFGGKERSIEAELYITLDSA